MKAINRRAMKRLAVDPAVSRRMAATHGRDNPAELALRSALHRQGYRFRVHTKVLRGSTRTADIAFPSRKVAIFLDGCFWHGCPIHATWPKTNAAAWRTKIETNRRRDRDTDRKLRATGWSPIRIWTHEDAEVAVKRVVRTLQAREKRRPAQYPKTRRGG
jgi:DNA mismatch endonuclease (patch repair protein)